MTAAIAIVAVSKVWVWARRFGGPGLVGLGLLDNSFIPIPGSVDVITIWFAVHHHKYWYYYSAMATVGALVGGYLTYGLARKGGKQALARRIGPQKTKSAVTRCEKWGFWSVFVPAMLPPPFPFVPFLFAAGALQYPKKKFLGALALGRGLRYFILGALGIIYGRQFLRFFNRYTKQTFYALLAMAVIACVLALISYYRYRNQHPSGDVPLHARKQPAS